MCISFTIGSYGYICCYRFLYGTVTKVTTVYFVCILWHYFVLNKYQQFLFQFLADSHCALSFSLCFQFLTVLLVSHCVFSFSLCFTLSYYMLLQVTSYYYMFLHVTKGYYK